MLKDTFQTIRCLDCKLIFTKGITPEALEKFYDNSYFNNDDSIIGYKNYVAEEHGHRENAQRLLAKIDRTHPLQGKTVLDVGCAAGFLLDEARSRYNCEVHGVEPSAAINQHAKNIFGIDVRGCPLESADFSPESFDVIFLIGTIEHLAAPRIMLHSIYQLLKPDGVLALTTIDTKGLFPLYSIKPPEHIIYFSHSNIGILLRQCGYKNISHTMQFATYRAADLFHRLFEFSGVRFFCWLERLANRFGKNVHFGIPTNEMLVLAQRPK